MNTKIVTINALQKLIKNQYKNKKTGIITGCFDVLHTGHIDLFQFAKKHVDILIVGIDTDTAIRKTKGESRPINSQRKRAKMLTSIVYVDNVLILTNKHTFGSRLTYKYYEDLIFKLKPNYLITCHNADSYWRLKKEQIEKVGGIFSSDNRKKSGSTSNIVFQAKKGE